ncbi:PepSY domain-containing protein [Planococcus sp. MERTA32b]|nr:PepSY domain-containing protein [Planococcus sp. MER TA 32b]
MKKLILFPAAAGVLAFGGIVLANNDSVDLPGGENSKSAETQNTATEKLIGIEKASSIALGLSDGKVISTELDEDDGRQHYEVEVQDSDYEYDYEIDAFSGEVLERDRDRLDDDDDREVSLENSNGTQASGDKMISAEQAAEIALKESGGGAVVELELDRDDGIRHYDVEIVDGNKEFELEINAADGKILKFEQDNDDDDDDRYDD